VVVHEDLALAADAEVLALALSGVGHGDEGDVRVIESLGRLPVIELVSNMFLTMVSQLCQLTSRS
jgi:hypothetical protein